MWITQPIKDGFIVFIYRCENNIYIVSWGGINEQITYERKEELLATNYLNQ